MLLPRTARRRRESSSPRTGDSRSDLQSCSANSRSRVQLSISTGMNFWAVIVLQANNTLINYTAKERSDALPQLLLGFS